MFPHTIPNPAGVSVTWLVGCPRTGALVASVEAMLWPEGKVFAWIGRDTAAACLCAGGRGLDRREHLAIGYWKCGMSEPEYKARHDNDRDADYHATARETPGR